MDVNTGHLVSEEEYMNMKEEARRNYEPVPENLTLSAQLELMGKDETIVGKEATSGIATWARSKREDMIKALREKANVLEKKLDIPVGGGGQQ